MYSQQRQSSQGNVGARRGADKGARVVGKPKARTKKLSRPLKHQKGGLRTALLGAFFVGGFYGALQPYDPWRGAGIPANLGVMIGCGLGLAALMAVVWSLTALRNKMAALIWR